MKDPHGHKKKYPRGYSAKYIYDAARAKLGLKIVKHGKDFVEAAQPGYKVLNFPTTHQNINKVSVGKIMELPPTGGIEIEGIQTDYSCAMNAAMIFNNKNNIGLTPTSEAFANEDLNYKIKDSKETQVFSSGLYSQIAMPATTLAPSSSTVPSTEPSAVPSAAPTLTNMIVELSGTILPKDGGKITKIDFDKSRASIGTKTIGLWIGIKPIMCTKDNAFLYYENGVDMKPQNSQNTFLVFKNTHLPIVIKYKASDATELRLTADMGVPFILRADSKIVNYSIYPQSNDTGYGSQIYYNFQKNISKCTVYDSALLDTPEKYGDEIVEQIASFKLTEQNSETVDFVGLNETGGLTVYYTDAGPTSGPSTGPGVVPSILKSRPVKNNNGEPIVAKNKGKNGENRIATYKMVLDDSVRQMSNTKHKIVFPIDAKIDRRKLAENREWKKKDKKYLESIDNSGQTLDRNKKVPSMKITSTMPLFSKNHKIKMVLEPETNPKYLNLYMSMNNTNNLVSVTPDFKMGKAFVADENMSITTLHLVNDTNLKKNGWHSHPGYGPVPGPNKYEISQKQNALDCSTKASAKSHYFVVKDKNSKEFCYVPNTDVSNKGPVFIPNNNGSLYVPSKYITSGDVAKDRELKFDTNYKFKENAYSKNDYSNYILEKKAWTPETVLQKKVSEFNSTDNVNRNALGLNSNNNVNTPATVMIKNGFKNMEGFADVPPNLITNTISQINSDTIPRFNSYLAKQTRVNKNADSIRANIMSNNTTHDLMRSTTLKTGGVTNNEFYDYTGDEIYSLKEDRSLVPALLRDQQTMVVEHNNLFVISTITVATLLITAIVVSSK